MIDDEIVELFAAHEEEVRVATEMTGAGYRFLIVAIILGAATGGFGGFPIPAGIAMLLLVGLACVMGR